ncbi:MAG: molybdopterin biosynthesis protein [Methyloceanibacter sp.]|nr:MAG: molybdopterin biosynthesis protein [Methyloceanibacter sp.]
MLTDDEIARYRRHLVLKEIGGEGQQRLKASRVLVIGAGGLGSPLILYLAAAGIGQIGVIDDDRVSLDNLQRQIVHETESVGRPKTRSAAAAVWRLNPHVDVKLYTTRLVAENALSIVGAFDIVADGSDNFGTRYLLNDACYFAKRPLVAAALGPFDGQLTTFRAFETDEDGTPRPSYRCLFPAPPPDGTVPACSEAGILGAVAGVLGCSRRWRWSRNCSESAKDWSGGCCSTTRFRHGSPRSGTAGTLPTPSTGKIRSIRICRIT